MLNQIWLRWAFSSNHSKHCLERRNDSFELSAPLESVSYSNVFVYIVVSTRVPKFLAIPCRYIKSKLLNSIFRPLNSHVINNLSVISTGCPLPSVFPQLKQRAFTENSGIYIMFSAAFPVGFFIICSIFFADNYYHLYWSTIFFSFPCNTKCASLCHHNSGQRDSVA